MGEVDRERENRGRAEGAWDLIQDLEMNAQGQAEVAVVVANTVCQRKAAVSSQVH